MDSRSTTVTATACVKVFARHWFLNVERVVHFDLRSPKTACVSRNGVASGGIQICTMG